MRLRQTFKSFALKTFPERLLKALKLYHYRRTLKALTDASELDFKVVKNLVALGDSVVDIGANIGVYTKYFSDLIGNQGRVYSIEPVPLTFDMLKTNVLHLALANVELFQLAISNENGLATMEIPTYESGGENFYMARITLSNDTHSTRRLSVPTRTLDSLLELPTQISFIKCDVEGHEYKCIQGAKRILETSRPALLIEISGNPDEDQSLAQKTFALLSESGYQSFWYDGSSLKPRRTGDRSINYFFLTTRHLLALHERGFPIQTDPPNSQSEVAH